VGVPEVMPMRPLTFAELLDAAIALLRTHARIFLGAALLLATLEQVVLYPLRSLAGIRPPDYSPYSDRLGEFWLAFAGGMGTEAGIIALLGTLTATAAGPALLGQRLAGRALLRGAIRKVPGALLIALIAGTLAAIAATAALIPWIFVYGLIGLATPALVIDRVNPLRAVGRSFVLAGRAGLRATWLRVGGYLSWLAIRLALGFGGGAALNLVLPQSGDWRILTSVLTWLLVDTIAYATLACLDSVLYLETRMRTEALDITIGRARHQGRPVDLAGVRS